MANPNLPVFAGTVAPADLVAKLDQQAATIDARTASDVSRIAAIEAQLRRHQGYSTGLPPETFPAPYSSLDAWRSATRRGALTFTGGFDTDGRCSLVKLADLPGGVQRWALGYFSHNGTGAGGPGGVAVFDVAADGSLSMVRNSPTLLGSNTGGNGPFANSLFEIGRASDTLLKYRYLSMSGSSNNNNLTSYGTIALDTANNANTLSATGDVSNAGGTITTNGYQSNGGVFRKRGWLTGLYSLVFPIMDAVVNPLAAALTTAASQAALLVVDRLPGSTNWDVGFPNGGLAGTNMFSLDHIGGSLFWCLTDGKRTGRTTLAQAGKVSILAVDDALRGAVGATDIPFAVAGNGRLFALSQTLAVVGWTSGSQYGSYAAKRDPATNQVAWIGAQDTAGIAGTVPAEGVPHSAKRLAVYTPVSGWTFNCTTVSVNDALPVGDPASPFAQVAQFAMNLGSTIVGAIATDTTILGATAKAGGDRVITVTANTTRGGIEVAVHDKAA